MFVLSRSKRSRIQLASIFNLLEDWHTVSITVWCVGAQYVLWMPALCRPASVRGTDKHLCHLVANTDLENNSKLTGSTSKSQMKLLSAAGQRRTRRRVMSLMLDVQTQSKWMEHTLFPTLDGWKPYYHHYIVAAVYMFMYINTFTYVLCFCSRKKLQTLISLCVCSLCTVPHRTLSGSSPFTVSMTSE